MGRQNAGRTRRSNGRRSPENNGFQIHLPSGHGFSRLGSPERVTVLDATAFYAGVPYTSLATYYTTDSVVKEVSHRKAKSVSIEDLVEAGRLRIYNPSTRSEERVQAAAQRSGDFSSLSGADISVVALALELKERGSDVTVISDDYAVENLSSILGIKRVSVMTGGIKKVVEWLTYCPGCGKVFRDQGLQVCDVCGSTLKRKFKSGSGASQKTPQV
ncbi:MAG: nucleotide-binding protein [Thaumarchaeota archaeon]|nr:nucleotide-binding protein [Nitrososphaerota archaeon]MCL5317500.1 nucleotide-binding protein [Nitrososphaerota archaeon]